MWLEVFLSVTQKPMEREEAGHRARGDRPRCSSSIFYDNVLPVNPHCKGILAKFYKLLESASELGQECSILIPIGGLGFWMVAWKSKGKETAESSRDLDGSLAKAFSTELVWFGG